MDAVGVRMFLSQGDEIEFGQLEATEVEAARANLNLHAVDVDAANAETYVVQKKRVEDGSDISLNDSAVVFGIVSGDDPAAIPRIWYGIPLSQYGGN